MHLICNAGTMSDVFRSHCTGKDSTSGCWMYESESRMRRFHPNLLQVEAFNHQAELTTGVLEEECSQMMKSFFKELRKKQKMKKKEQESANMPEENP